MGFPRATEQPKECNRARVDPLTNNEAIMLARFLPPVTLDPTTWPDADPEPTVCRGENCGTIVKHEGDLCEECQICMAEHRND